MGYARLTARLKYPASGSEICQTTRNSISASKVKYFSIPGDEFQSLRKNYSLLTPCGLWFIILFNG